MLDFIFSWDFFWFVLVFYIGYILGKLGTAEFQRTDRLAQLERLAKSISFPSDWVSGTVKVRFDGELLSKEAMARSGLLIRVFGAHGSGVYLSSCGLVLTNAHVVGDQTVVEIEDGDGSTILGRVVKINKERDVALVMTAKVTSKFPAVCGITQMPTIGDDLFISGAPIRESNKGYLSKGILSKIGPFTADDTSGELEYMHSDTPIAPGNSGGPVYNDNGALVALSVAIQLDQNGGQTHMGLLIPIYDALKHLDLEQLNG